jgi:hypothetical protein
MGLTALFIVAVLIIVRAVLFTHPTLLALSRRMGFEQRGALANIKRTDYERK